MIGSQNKVLTESQNNKVFAGSAHNLRGAYGTGSVPGFWGFKSGSFSTTYINATSGGYLLAPYPNVLDNQITPINGSPASIPATIEQITGTFAIFTDAYGEQSLIATAGAAYRSRFDLVSPTTNWFKAGKWVNCNIGTFGTVPSDFYTDTFTASYKLFVINRGGNKILFASWDAATGFTLWDGTNYPNTNLASSASVPPGSHVAGNVLSVRHSFTAGITLDSVALFGTTDDYSFILETTDINTEADYLADVALGYSPGTSSAYPNGNQEFFFENLSSGNYTAP